MFRAHQNFSICVICVFGAVDVEAFSGESFMGYVDDIGKRVLECVYVFVRSGELCLHLSDEK